MAIAPQNVQQRLQHNRPFASSPPHLGLGNKRMGFARRCTTATQSAFCLLSPSPWPGQQANGICEALHDCNTIGLLPPPPSPWPGQQANGICEALQRDREPDANLSHNEGQVGNRNVGQGLELQRCPVVHANAPFVAQLPYRTSKDTVRDGRASVLNLGRLPPTRVEGFVKPQ